MKRILSLCLLAALLAAACGCGAEQPGESVNFYYQRSAYVYGTADGVIAAESRDISNRANTLLYLLTLYFQGPIDPGLKAPFPDDCSIQSVSRDGSTLCVTLDPCFATLTDTDLTIACACIARTCFSLSDATQVQIRAEGGQEHHNVNVVISVDSLLLDDRSGLSHQAITQESQ